MSNNTSIQALSIKSSLNVYGPGSLGYNRTYMKNDSPKPKVGLSDNKQEEACEWHINSPEHFNCFWAYVLDKSGPDGSMPELVQSEIAQLLGWSNTKTHFMLKQATAELIEAFNKYKANQLLASNPEQKGQLPLIDFEVATNYNPEDPEE